MFTLFVLEQQRKSRSYLLMLNEELRRLRPCQTTTKVTCYLSLAFKFIIRLSVSLRAASINPEQLGNLKSLIVKLVFKVLLT